MGEKRLVETADPGEAFTALSDGTRVGILRALWDADDPLTFSDLRGAVGMRDSGQFNYHLDKLVGRFVRKTDAGYDLTLAGQHVNGAIHGGAYTMEGTIDPIDLEEPCPVCGGELTLRYENEVVHVNCDSCDMRLEGGVPPSVFAGTDRADIPAVTARYMRTIVHHIGNGFCWHCDGPVEPTVFEPYASADNSEKLDPRHRGLPLVRFQCERCDAEVTGDLGNALLNRPSVVAFYHDHGIDVHDQQLWEVSAMSTDRAEIRERDPLRAVVRYPAGGETLRLVVDEDLSVQETERVE